MACIVEVYETPLLKIKLFEGKFKNKNEANKFLDENYKGVFADCVVINGLVQMGWD